MTATVDELFERAVAEATAFRQAAAERLLRRVLDRLARGDVAEVSRERVLLSLANVRAERGHMAEGLAILGELENSPTAGLAGLVQSQRGLLLLRSGRPRDALACFEGAVPLLAHEPRPLAVVLINRGMLHLTLGDRPRARKDLERCVVHCAEHGLSLIGGRARFNLAYLSFLAGDLPAALHDLDGSWEQLTSAGDGDAMSAVYHLDRARILQAAGLLAESDQELVQAASAFHARRSRQDEAECELARALIALTEGRYDDAIRAAGRARAGFDRRGSQGFSLLARLVVLRARFGRRVGTAGVARGALLLADELAAAGLAEDAQMARLLAVRAQVWSNVQDPSLTLRDLAGSPRAGITARLYARQARAELARATGQPGVASRELKAGLRELARYQASFGSLDLQTAVVRHGRALAGMGLEAAVADGRPGTVFAWSERARATASRLPPVRPPEDPEAALLLEELRYVRTEQRAAELGGRDDPGLRQRRGELERLVRQRSWYAAGPGDVAEPVPIGLLRGALAAAGGATFVAHLVVGDDVHALVVTAGRSRLVALGPVDAALQRIRRLRADLDALALRNVPEPIRRSVTASVARGLAGLGDQLWQPLAPLVADGPVLLVPSGSLVAAPWTLLPALAGRPVTLARSATAWLRAHDGARPLAAATSRVVLAAGPDLARAQDEVTEIAPLWQHATTLTGDGARGGPVLDAADGADVVHLAAHGLHEAANPLFAALRLADGPLFGYDLARLHRMPALVVLSACELGQVTERPGDEVVGMTAALLHQGAGTVIASVAKVSDDVAFEVTLALHQGLRRGQSASAALAAATAGRPDAPFVAFGAGW